MWTLDQTSLAIPDLGKTNPLRVLVSSSVKQELLYNHHTWLPRETNQAQSN